MSIISLIIQVIHIMINDSIILERFFRYIKIDTQSDEDSETSPSSKKQLVLAKLLVNELKELGLQNVSLDENGYVMASLPSNTEKKVAPVGFISHMDTSPDMSGANIKPQVIENYNGTNIMLNKEKNIVLSPEEFPELKQYIGNTIITTDGTTLLGADDKAGIAEIMTAMEYLINNPEIKHGDIQIGFTPDEEIGRGADHFDVKKFGAKYAYTVDGSGLGEIEYETFNASKATIHVQGRNVHPGYAKNKMVNSLKIAQEFDQSVPQNERPYNTEGYEGYYHLLEIHGNVESTEMLYIIRDHNKTEFEKRNRVMEVIVDKMNEKHKKSHVKMDLKHQYYNMREKIEPVFFIVEIAKKAIKEAGIEPIVKPVRGGTDGAKLSYMGLPCPNLFTGGHNFHGKYEFIPVESMKKAAEVIVNICGEYVEEAADS